MLYVGAYQVRAVEHLVCPIFGRGCDTVADAPFAHLGGVSNALILAGLYGSLILLAVLEPSAKWVRHSIQGIALLIAAANLFGMADMMHIGTYSFYFLLTTAISPALAVLTFRNLDPNLEP
jgi:hypothetical protein